MSLFSKLLRLGPSDTEDYLTEIVAHMLTKFPDKGLAWLRDAEITKLQELEDWVVNTQEELPALDSHEGIGSRPDMAIRLGVGSRREIIYIESKVGSKEGMAGDAKGLNQLQRYADHLVNQEGFDVRTLVFITRDFEPKERPRGEVHFFQLRWSQFYAYFKHLAASDPLTTELLQYMEENNMSQSNQFTVLDLLAITNFTKARKMMDATMWDSVYVKFKKIFGNKWSVPTDASSQLHQHNRYVMYSKQGMGDPILVLLGFWVHDDSVTNTPTAGVQIQVSPKYPQKNEVVSAFRSFVEKKLTWWAFGLGDDRAWSCIGAERDLQSFLAESDGDHVMAITKYFKELLDEVAEFISESRNLPWYPDVVANPISTTAA